MGKTEKEWGLQHLVYGEFPLGNSEERLQGVSSISPVKSSERTNNIVSESAT